MNSDRIEELQKRTAYPESRSVALALMQVWNECAQENNKQINEMRDIVKHHINKTCFLRKKREYAENQLSSANNRIKALLSSVDIMLNQRSADVDEIKRLERLLESANRRISELNIILLDARGVK